jgi:hypothetical protein
MQASIANRQPNRALSVLEAMVKERVQPDSRMYAILIRSGLFQDKPEQADALFRSALGLPGAYSLPGLSLVACYPLDHKFVHETLTSFVDKGYTQSLAAPLMSDLKSSRLKVNIEVVRRLLIRTLNPACMQINIVQLSGESIALDVLETSTLNGLRSKVCEEMSIPAVQQKFLLDSSELTGDHLTLAELGVQSGTSLTMVRTNQPEDIWSLVPIFVRWKNPPEYPKGSILYTVDIPLASSVEELKEQLSLRSCRFQGKSYKLTLQDSDEELSDTSTLCDYFLDAYSTLEVHVDDSSDQTPEIVRASSNL